MPLHCYPDPLPGNIGGGGIIEPDACIPDEPLKVGVGGLLTVRGGGGGMNPPIGLPEALGGDEPELPGREPRGELLAPPAPLCRELANRILATAVARMARTRCCSSGSICAICSSASERILTICRKCAICASSTGLLPEDAERITPTSARTHARTSSGVMLLTGMQSSSSRLQPGGPPFHSNGCLEDVYVPSTGLKLARDLT